MPDPRPAQDDDVSPTPGVTPPRLLTGMTPALTLPAVSLPARVAKPTYRPAQSNVPNDRATRDRLKSLARDKVDAERLVPPLSMPELRARAAELRAAAGVEAIYDDFIGVLINNAAWRSTLAQIPYDRRLLLLPKCLRVEERCPAPFDEFGLLCKECGLCSIQDLTVEADRLGYAVLVAEGSAIVRQMIETGRIEAVVGVSCLNVLERSFPHMEAAAVPGVAIPLLQDDCINCTVDLDWVWDVIHLTADDKTHRLDLEVLKDEVQGWFQADQLDQVMGEAGDETAGIARDWLARSGKRWRPYLATCVHLALACDRGQQHGQDDEPHADANIRKLAVAIECFHKASLIHDDIEDGDAERYGLPALHVEHGEAVALNVGDFLLGEGYRLIAEIEAPAETKVEMLRAAADGHVTLCRGQGAELSWARDPRPLSSLEVLQIFRQKTAPAFDVALRLGALYAGADREVHEVLGEYSESLGIAYQVRDDLEDHTGESDSDDLRDLRPSLLLAIAHKRAREGDERELIEALWRRAKTYDDVAGDVHRILRERGVVDKANELLQAYEEQAVRSLRFLHDATLKGLLRRVVGKIFPRALIEGYCSEFEARNAPGGAARTQSAG
jgi:geranylgeranyl diphosphate synthase type II